MKKIGFIDYYLSEWHANNYPAWIKQAGDELREEFKVECAWGEVASPLDGKTSEEWCGKFGVRCCSTIEEVCDNVDFVIILAPSDPEKHLEYAKRVFPFGKNTFIDKTFTDSYADACEIYELAKKYSVNFFSTSALRYAFEIEKFEGNCSSVITTGGGSDLPEYCIHQIEMICKLIKDEPVRIKCENRGKGQYVFDIDFEADKKATLLWAGAYPFTVCISDNEGRSRHANITSPFFYETMKNILGFFLSGKPPFDAKETLNAMRIRDHLLKALKNEGLWLNIE